MSDDMEQRLPTSGAFHPPSSGAWNSFGPAYATRQCWNADDWVDAAWITALNGDTAKGLYVGGLYGYVE